MEKSFDFNALLQNHEKKHKNKPTQFISVAGGVRKRLESNIKSRKSSRLSNFDSIRNLPKYDSPLKEPNPLTKAEHRRLQLEKWKEEKQKKKKEAAAQKKKPFIAGVAHTPMTFIPPPPLPKAVPSTSGRVTRSQSAKINSNKAKSSKSTTQQTKTESFAPQNAAFKAPDLKNMGKLPTLVPLSKIKKTKETIMFDPVVPSMIRMNSKTKLNQTKNKNVSDKVISHVEHRNRTLRGRGKIDKVASSSSSQSHSSGDKPSPPPKESKSKIKTAYVKSSSDERSDSENTKSKTKTSRKSIRSSEDVTSPASQPQHKAKTPRKSISTNYTSTPKNPIPKSESSSEERLRSPKSPVNVPLTPEQIVEEAKKNSPFVTLSRGKANARRETKQKINAGLFEEDASDVNSVDHFRRQLNSEIKRLTELCETWEKISEQAVLPENVQEAVLGAVGQARLLMSHKLQQFAALVARCERPEPALPPVTPADLHGFWDMVFMQVVNVDVRFKKLEEMRARNWAEEAVAAPRRKPPPRAKPAARPAAASRLRDLIAAARRAKKQEQLEGASGPAEEPAKTFEAGFFCVRSPVRSPVRAPATPRAPAPPAPTSLLKAVLSSEAKKSATKNMTSLAMLRASLIGKGVETDSPVTEPQIPLTPINLHATPARSILKPVNVPSSKKSIKVVLFDDSDVSAEDETKNVEHSNDISGVEKLEDGTPESGVSPKVEPEKQKENKSRKKSLIRQDAITETSPIMTRSRRKSIATTEVEDKTPKRTSLRKKALQEVEINIIEEKSDTPKRSSRKRSVIKVTVA